jgi:hypothetical protein
MKDNKPYGTKTVTFDGLKQRRTKLTTLELVKHGNGIPMGQVILKNKSGASYRLRFLSVYAMAQHSVCMLKEG